MFWWFLFLTEPKLPHPLSYIHSVIYGNPQLYPYIHVAIYFITFIWKEMQKGGSGKADVT